MQSFFWHVLSNKLVYDKLVAEILAADLSEMVQYEETQNLSYFQACLKEAMRISPAVGLNITRKVPVNGAEIDGIKLPGGAAVAVNGWVLHRHKGIFGEDADIYRPERWLEGDKDKIKLMERCMFQVSPPKSTVSKPGLYLIVVLNAVWRWFSSLHRTTSRAPRNEQSLTAAHSSLRHPARQSGQASRTSLKLFRGTVGLVDLPETQTHCIVFNNDQRPTTKLTHHQESNGVQEESNRDRCVLYPAGR